MMRIRVSSVSRLVEFCGPGNDFSVLRFRAISHVSLGKKEKGKKENGKECQGQKDSTPLESNKGDDRFKLNEASRSMNEKVSTMNGPTAIFLECLDSIRRSWKDVDHNVHTTRSCLIDKLTQDELELTRGILHRTSVDYRRNVDKQGTKEDGSADEAHSKIQVNSLNNHGMDPIASSHTYANLVDPYWDPYVMHVDKTKDRVVQEFDKFVSLSSIREARRVKSMLRRSLMSGKLKYDSYSDVYRRWLTKEAGEPLPKPHKVPDRFWEPSNLQRQLRRERITWKDVDIIQHFRAQNGYILPRRITMLSRRKQLSLVRAICKAQNMALIPYDSNQKPYTAMPLMDPIQWVVDRLTKISKMSIQGIVPGLSRDPTVIHDEIRMAGNTSNHKNLLRTNNRDSITPERANAMLKVMSSTLYTKLDYSEWISITSKHDS